MDENRIKAPMPEFSVGELVDRKFYKSLEKFHDDRLPFRGLLIKAKNWIDYSIFNRSPSTIKVYIGNEGWLFHTPRINDYLKNACDGKGKMMSLAKDLQRMERKIEAAGRLFVFVVAPNKSTIYPEFVGVKRSDNGCNKSHYDLLLEAFEEYPVKGFVRLDDLLLKAKDGRRLYTRTDTHWNVHGATIASEAILAKISPSWKSYYPEFEITTEKRMFDLANMIDMYAKDLREEEFIAEEISYISDVTVEEKEPLENGRPRLSFYGKSKSGIKLLPRAIIYRDSFMTHPLKLIQGSFERIDTLWTSKVPTKEGVELSEIKTAEIIIVETVETSLTVLEINSDELGL